VEEGFWGINERASFAVDGRTPILTHSSESQTDEMLRKGGKGEGNWEEKTNHRSTRLATKKESYAWGSCRET